MVFDVLSWRQSPRDVCGMEDKYMDTKKSAFSFFA